jgi:hypothetical protein
MLKELVKIKNYSFESGLTSAGRGKYDMCYIYNSDILELVSIQDITSSDGSRTLKVAQRLNFLEKFTGMALFILASHWPSRLRTGEYEPVRDELGLLLHQSINQLKLADGTLPHVILLGDYNEEQVDTES